MKKRIRKKKMLGAKQASDVAVLVDMPFEKFKSEVERQKVSLGLTNGLVLYLSSLYADLRNRKDAVIDMCFRSGMSKESVSPALKGLYAEMFKLEEKIVFLKDRSKELIEKGKHV